MIMMIKRNDDCYELYMQHPKELDKLALLSKSTKKDYDFMLQTLAKMRDRNYVGDFYLFPRADDVAFTAVRLIHYAQDHYVIDGNYHHIFSEMIDIEFAMMIFELECLPNHQNGTPSYFPPAKDKDNDK